MKKTLAKRTIVIGSGKGGVGKSTVAVNLAVALAQQGLTVSLLDADIYGPSIPIMMGLRRLEPQSIPDEEGRKKILPFKKFGVEILSIGFFVEESQPITWRGPMLHNTLQKMIDDVAWSDSEILLIDLPPGTGDIPISLSQYLKIDGALIVTTPQEVAVADALRALNSYDQLEIPILGIIENMAGYHLPQGGVDHLFGKGKAKLLADRFSLPLLASIPLDRSIREGGDQGVPPAFHRNPGSIGHYFAELASRIL